MKPFLVLLFCAIFSGEAFSQSADSLFAAKQVDSLIQVSRTATGKSNFDEALAISEQADGLALKHCGKNSAAYGKVCFNFGRIHYFRASYADSERWYLQSKEIRATVLGSEHPDFAMTLNNLAVLYFKMDDWEKAEQMHLQTKAIRAKIFGKTHPDYAQTLQNLAAIYTTTGQLDKAELIWLETLAIREQTLGREHPDYAASLHGLGNLYKRMGLYEKAASLIRQANEIRRKVLGTEHPEYAHGLHSMAICQHYMGNFEAAEPFFLESKAILEKTLGAEHPSFGSVVNDLGNFYIQMGNYQKAHSLLLEAKEIRGKKNGQKNQDYAATLVNLSSLYWYWEQFEQVEPLLLEALAIFEISPGKEHTIYADCLVNLGGYYQWAEKWAQSEACYLQAKDIRETVLGKNHADFAASLNNLAVLYRITGRYPEAFNHFQEARKTWGEALGKQHQLYARCLNNLAILSWDMGDRNAACAFSQEADEVEMRLVSNAVRHLSERELANYSASFSHRWHQSFSFARSQPVAHPNCFDLLLFQKGFLQNAAAKINNLPFADSAAAENHLQLKALNRRLAAEYAKPIADRKGVEDLETRANDLEKTLARTVAGYGEAIRQVKWQEVQAALKPGEAAIEFVHYNFWDKTLTDSVLYAALVLLPGNEPPKFVPLFEEKHLDALLQRGNASPEVFFKNLYEFSGEGKTLHRLVWQPIEKVLNALPSTVRLQPSTVFCSPSGLLHRLNLGAIPVSETEKIADRFKLVELGSTRQLVVNQTFNPGQNTAALFGGIQYDLDLAAIPAAAESGQSSSLRGALSFSMTDSTLRSLSPNLGNGDWKYLPGSEKEVVEIEKTMSVGGFQIQKFQGKAASEEAFKSLGSRQNSPRILHLSTHGFFFPDPISPHGKNASVGFDEPVFKISEHPMIRSGLILAGGNHAWKTGKPLRPDMEDGILTAYEISQMDLSNTELVVLSACETGLGQIQGNEGVYGLQRAFKIAGAKYLIMSLWQVDDRQTSRLMSLFYQKWLSEKMAVPEAFRAAQKELRERGFDPFYWAGFVLVE